MVAANPYAPNSAGVSLVVQLSAVYNLKINKDKTIKLLWTGQCENTLEFQAIFTRENHYFADILISFLFIPWLNLSKQIKPL